ncbi:hypothetical protein WN944_003511 [Citrus x changshan-huyou]|uniref:HAT C-terminal dimerisation domain-containing protein n=1 Tax=Citrus x changshan-huyou TaxID=2935761 RepID=A0AAP0LZC3_9ROSI
MDFVTWCFSSLYDTKKVEELCNSLKELLISYNSANPNSVGKTSCIVQSSGISEFVGSSSLDPFAQYKKIKASTQDGYGGQNEIAKDILIILVSTVTSESSFGAGGRIFNPFRSSLTPKTVKSLICTQNWLRSTLFRDPIIEAIEEETEFYEVVKAIHFIDSKWKLQKRIELGTMQNLTSSNFECVEHERIEGSALVIHDVSARWNSTYLLLESTMKFHKAFERMEDDD